MPEPPPEVLVRMRRGTEPDRDPRSDRRDPSESASACW